MRKSTKLYIYSVLVVCFCCIYTVLCAADTNRSAALSPSDPLLPTEENELVPLPTEEDNVSEEFAIKEPEISEEELFWQKCWAQYPVATEIWLQMKSYGWSDAACAGIMGNFMRETAGDTLHIKSDVYNGNKSHYGLCQWSKRYYPGIHPTAEWTPSTAEQVEYLHYTIVCQRELCFRYGFDEDYLINATNCREVAKKFCDGYERPAENSTRRENNAEKAWRYFVLREDI